MIIGKVEPSGKPVVWTSLKLCPDLTGLLSSSTFPILTMPSVKCSFYLHLIDRDINTYHKMIFECLNICKELLHSIFLRVEAEELSRVCVQFLHLAKHCSQHLVLVRSTSYEILNQVKAEQDYLFYMYTYNDETTCIMQVQIMSTKYLCLP